MGIENTSTRSETMTTDRVQLNLRVKPDTRDALRAAAEDAGRSMADELDDLVEDIVVPELAERKR